MLKVGITGGIGSGKTIICQIFNTCGIPTYDADQRAKWLMNHSSQLIRQIMTHFGNESYTENGHLNKEFLSSVVFNDAKQLEKLNELVHPEVGKDYSAWLMEHSNKPYTIKEAAIMYESGSDQLLDKIITVFAPKPVRIRRVQERNGWEIAEIEARMSKQLPEIEKLRRADFVIMNDGSKSLIKQVTYIHNILVNLSND